MGLFSNIIRNKKIKAIRSRNVITCDWSDFLKNYPSVSTRLNNSKGDELKPYIHPSTKIKIYFNSDNVTFYLIDANGNEEKISHNVIYGSWDVVPMEELDELLK